jgi:hypothetical protein
VLAPSTTVDESLDVMLVVAAAVATLSALAAFGWSRHRARLRAR